jgi:ATPase subunit of ABC transporter with duplicated ATPase domains
MSVLKQDHFAYDQFNVLDTIIMGNTHLYEIMKKKDALYEKPDFNDEDGILVSELEGQFAELNGWEAESDASRLIQGLGLDESVLYSSMSSLNRKRKVKVLWHRRFSGILKSYF